MALATILTLPALPASMASRWRRRVRCTLIADRELPVLLLELSGRAATVAMECPPAGATVTLCHPVAGRIAARVGAHLGNIVRLHLASDAESVGFAMVAIAADMTLGG